MKSRTLLLSLGLILLMACGPLSAPTLAPTGPELSTPAMVEAAFTSSPSPVPSDTPQLPASILQPSPTSAPPTNPPQASPTPMPAIGAGTQMRALSDSRLMAFVPAGPFLMGASDFDPDATAEETPQHQVSLEAFWIDLYEVTHIDYGVCVQAGACHPPAKLDARGFPYEYASQVEEGAVVNVTWQDASDYCAWAGKRLPTEAEWEKAARGEDGRIYPWGNDSDTFHQAWYCTQCIFDENHPDVYDDFSRPAPVGSFPGGASPYGVLDMAGNVWEWVSDWYASNTYRQPEHNNPTGPEKGEMRVVRGGSWTSYPPDLRTTYREARNPSTAWINVGFRCVLADDRSKLVEVPLPTSTPPPQPTPTPKKAPSATPASLAVASSTLLVPPNDPNFKNTLYSMAWSPDSRTLAMGDAQGAIHLWDVAKEELSHTLWIHTGIVHAIAFSPDGKLLASGGSDKTVIIWELADWFALRTLKGHTNSVTKVLWSPDGSQVASQSYDNTVVLWEVNTGRRLLTAEADNNIQDFALSPDGKMLALAMFDQTVVLLDAATGERLRVLDGHTDRVGMVAWAPSGKILASRSLDGALRLWDTTTWEHVRMLNQPGSKSERYFMAWSPDSRLIASSSNREPINLWDAAAGAKLFPLGTKVTLGLAWSPDGSILASQWWDGITLWYVRPVLP